MRICGCSPPGRPGFCACAAPPNPNTDAPKSNATPNDVVVRSIRFLLTKMSSPEVLEPKDRPSMSARLAVAHLERHASGRRAIRSVHHPGRTARVHPGGERLILAEVDERAFE